MHRMNLANELIGYTIEKQKKMQCRDFNPSIGLPSFAIRLVKPKKTLKFSIKN